MIKLVVTSVTWREVARCCGVFAAQVGVRRSALACASYREVFRFGDLLAPEWRDHFAVTRVA